MRGGCSSAALVVAVVDPSRHALVTAYLLVAHLIFVGLSYQTHHVPEIGTVLKWHLRVARSPVTDLAYVACDTALVAQVAHRDVEHEHQPTRLRNDIEECTLRFKCDPNLKELHRDGRIKSED